MNLELNKAVRVRDTLTKTQLKNIRRLYNSVYKDVKEQAQSISFRNVSDALRAQNLKELSKLIDERLTDVTTELEKAFRKDMRTTSKAVCTDIATWNKKAGLGITGSFVSVPDKIVKDIATGAIYDKRWYLSTAIWGNKKEQMQTVDNIIAKGIIGNKSTYDIAKDLETYVNPSRTKAWKGVDYIAKDGRRALYRTKSIDYNAQRLARTLINHAYQKTFEDTTRKNPFVTSYTWHSALNARTCELCASRDGQVYDKGSLPLDHPQGLCTYEANIPASQDEIGSRIADWYNNKSGFDKELDDYADYLRKS